MPTVTRVMAAAAALLIGQTLPLSAQFEIGVFGGAHIQRSDLMERRVSYVYPEEPTSGFLVAYQVNGRGTATAMGMVAGFALAPIFRLELQVWTSRNDAWRLVPAFNGRVPASNEVIPGFHVRKTIINPRFTLVPLTRSGLELRVSGGLARVSLSGSGESTLDEDTAMGGALTGGVLVAITRGVVLAGEGSFMAYSGKVRDDVVAGPPGQQPDIGRGDWLATLGLRARFGKRPSRGSSHGPGVVPSLGPH